MEQNIPRESLTDTAPDRWRTAEKWIDEHRRLAGGLLLLLVILGILSICFYLKLDFEQRKLKRRVSIARNEAALEKILEDCAGEHSSLLEGVRIRLVARYLDQRKYDKALELLKELKSYGISPEIRFHAMENIGYAYLASGRPELAVQAFSEFLLMPDAPEPNRLRAAMAAFQLEIRHGRPASARRFLEYAAGMNAETPEDQALVQQARRLSGKQ